MIGILGNTRRDSLAVGSLVQGAVCQEVHGAADQKELEARRSSVRSCEEKSTAFSGDHRKEHESDKFTGEYHDCGSAI